MALVLDWKEKLGYKLDPFEDTPFFKNIIIGLNELREKINLFLIKDKKIAIIKADSGFGKTTFLLWLFNELKKEKIKSLFIDLKEIRTKNDLLSFLINNTATILERLVFKKKELKEEEKINLLKKRLVDYVIIVDNFHNIVKSQESLFFLLKDNNKLILSSLINKNEPKDFEKPDLKILIKDYKNNDLILLLKERIKSAGGYELFPFKENDIKKLIEKSKRNPRIFLKEAKDKAIELSLKTDYKSFIENNKDKIAIKNSNKTNNKITTELNNNSKKRKGFFIKIETVDDDIENNNSFKEKSFKEKINIDSFDNTDEKLKDSIKKEDSNEAITTKEIEELLKEINNEIEK